MKRYFVYMLRCADGSFYTGVTNNAERREWEHNEGFLEEAYTFKRRPVKLVYCAEFQWITEAIDWEKRVKGWSRKKKQALIKDDWPEIQNIVRDERRTREKKKRRRRGSSSP